MFDGITLKQLGDKLKTADVWGRRILITAYFCPEDSKWEVEVEISDGSKIERMFLDGKRGMRRRYASFTTLAKDMRSKGVSEMLVKFVEPLKEEESGNS